MKVIGQELKVSHSWLIRILFGFGFLYMGIGLEWNGPIVYFYTEQSNRHSYGREAETEPSFHHKINKMYSSKSFLGRIMRKGNYKLKLKHFWWKM